MLILGHTGKLFFFLLKTKIQQIAYGQDIV